MKTSILKTIAFLFLVVAACTVQAQDEMQQYFTEVEKRYDDAEGDAARLELCIEILTKYPETDYTKMILDMAENHSSALDKIDEFILLAEKVQGQVESEELKHWIDRRLLGAFGKTKNIDRLEKMTAKLTALGEENFNFYYDLMRAYTDAEQWAPVLAYAEKAEPFANAEAYKKDYESRNYPDEVLAKRGNNRKGLLLTYAGWAKANTGDVKTALEHFKAADAMVMHAYTGQSEGMLDYYWGSTLVEAGKLDQALDRLTPKALFESDDDAMALMKQAYVNKHGSDEAFDAFSKKQRLKFARPIDDFTLPTYDGNTLTLSSFEGKVILLSFWFPT